MNKIKTLIGGGIVATALAAGSIAGAAVTFDAATGTGFVGKGDVQLALGLNNSQLQKQADGLQFRINATETTETTWTCSRLNPQGTEQTLERERVTTSSTQGVVESVARVKNQITGFTLSGYDGQPTVSVSTEGPTAGSCPNHWTPSTPETSDAEVTGAGLSVNGVSLSPAAE